MCNVRVLFVFVDDDATNISRDCDYDCVTRTIPFYFYATPSSEVMGNIMRMAAYDRAGNMQNAVPSTIFLGSPDALKWHRLDDGVMGGQSETQHCDESGVLHFKGVINTNGGGFTSIRAPFAAGLLTDDAISALKIRHRGDGKTYKVLLSDGTSSGPMGTSPSWQMDLPTRQLKGSDEWETSVLPLDRFLPSFGGRSPLGEKDRSKYTLRASEMKEIGLMLSLRLADGGPNPEETFGSGVFDFSLEVESIEAVQHDHDPETDKDQKNHAATSSGEL
jgi:hypothetical protein